MLEYIRKSAESWGVKILFGLIILVFVFWGVGSYQGNKTQVVAYVNERPILEQAFLQRLEREMENVRRRNPTATQQDIEAMQLRQQVLSQMISRELLREEAARLHIGAAASEIVSAVRSYRGFYNEKGEFDPQIYRSQLARQGMSPAEFEQFLREDIIISKVGEYASLPAETDEEDVRELFNYSNEQRAIDYLLVEAASFMDQVEPSEEQIQAHYEQNKDAYMLPERMSVAYFDFTPEALKGRVEVAEAEIEAYYNVNKSAYRDSEQVKARHILLMVPDGATPQEEAKVKAQLQEIIAELEQGADFAELATQYSDDLTKDEGGDLGWVQRGEMVESFEEALFSTPVGELSELVRTPFGWHVIKVEERKEPRPKPLAEVKDEIRETLELGKAADILTDLLDRALEQIISGISMQQIAQSLEIELKTTGLLSQSETKSLLQLEDGALENLFAMQEGELTDTPLATDNGYLLAEVQERKPAELQPLEDVRDQVVEAVTRRLAMEKAKARADELAAAIAEGGLPQEQQAQLQTSEPFSRQGFIQGLGMNPNLAGVAFDTAQGEWLQEPYSVGNGYVLAKVAAVIEPPDQQWEQRKDQFIELVTNGNKKELFDAFLASLRQKAEIEIVNPRVLN